MSTHGTLFQRTNHSSSPARRPRTQMPMTRERLAFSTPWAEPVKAYRQYCIEGCLVPDSLFELAPTPRKTGCLERQKTTGQP